MTGYTDEIARKLSSITFPPTATPPRAAKEWK
jgi:hypothetical protein